MGQNCEKGQTGKKNVRLELKNLAMILWNKNMNIDGYVCLFWEKYIEYEVCMHPVHFSYSWLTPTKNCFLIQTLPAGVLHTFPNWIIQCLKNWFCEKTKKEGETVQTKVLKWW